MSNDKKMLSSIGYYKSSFQPLELHLYDMSHKNIEHVNMQVSAVPNWNFQYKHNQFSKTLEIIISPNENKPIWTHDKIDLNP